MTDPVLQRVLDGLARRAQALPEGPLRQRLHAAQARWAAQVGTPLPVPRPRDLAAGLLGTLMAEWRARLPGDVGQEAHGVHGGPGPPGASGLPGLAPDIGEPRLLQAHRREWAALRLAQRLAEAVPLPAAPAQIGPLHTQAVVPRALQHLQALSPGYLQGLLAQVDTLAQLAALSARSARSSPSAAATPPALAPRDPALGSPRAARSALRRSAAARRPAG